MNIIKGSSEIRKGRQSIVNGAYHAVFNTRNRQSIFSDFELAHTMRLCLKASDAQCHSETLAYCIMPDHIHWLFILKQHSLSAVIARTKSDFSRKTQSKIWQDSFYDHAIRSDEALIEVARYIVANPLRAGLVKNVSEYPHWDTIWL